MRHLPNWIKGFLDFTEGMEIPPLYAEWAAISCLSAALKWKCWLQIGRHINHPSLYVILVGPPGCGKGTTMGEVTRILEASDADIRIAPNTLGGLGLYKVLSEDVKQEIRFPNPINYNGTVLEDTTHSSLHVHAEELENFLGYDDFGIIPKLRELYDMEKEVFSHKSLHGDEVAVIHPCVNILGATIPDVFQDLKMRKAIISGGFGARTFLVYGNYTGKRRWDEMTPLQMQIKGFLARDLEDVCLLQGPFRLDNGVQSMWMDWREHWEANPLRYGKEFESFVIRGKANVARILMPICAARQDHNMTITQNDLAYAIDLTNRTCKEMPKVFSYAGQNPSYATMQNILNYLEAHGPQRRLTLFGQFVSEVRRYMFDQIITDLLALGEIEESRGDQPNTVIKRRVK